jgi:membrane protein DedA with SNARE-associated domain
MFDQLVDLVSNASAWAYAAILLVAAFDALLPIVPSETAVITAGVVAAAGELAIGLVVVCAAVGAAAGDNTGYVLGRRYGRHVKRLASSKRLAWAERQLATRGSELLVVARFVPGGRTAVTLTAGAVRFRWRRFALLDAAAAALWAGYAAALGYFGGVAFRESPWRGLLLALSVALVAALAVEIVRRARRR